MRKWGPLTEYTRAAARFRQEVGGPRVGETLLGLMAATEAKAIWRFVHESECDRTTYM